MSRRAEWREYGAKLQEMDRELDKIATPEGQPPSAEYSAAWHDRMGFAANRYPGAPEPVTYVTEISAPDPGDGGVQHLRSHFLQPEGEPEPEA